MRSSIRRLDAWVENYWYYPHLEPIWKALPSEAKGTCWVGPALLNKADPEFSIKATTTAPRFGEITMVAGFSDLQALRGSPAIRATHGADQSYAGDPTDMTACNHPSYPGGTDHDNVELFLCPSSYSADRWAKRYPSAKAAVIGSPKLDAMQHLPAAIDTTVVLALNWGSSVSPESTSALPDLIPHLPALREACNGNLIGHGHPRARPVFERFYGRAGIPYYPELDFLPSLVIADNTSWAWENAALGVPVVWVNASAYRDVPHGLRFGGTGGMAIAGVEHVARWVNHALAKTDVTMAITAQASWIMGHRAYADMVDGNASKRAVDAILAIL